MKHLLGRRRTAAGARAHRFSALEGAALVLVVALAPSSCADSISPPAPTTLAAASLQDQTATVGTPVSTPPAVKVTDANGNAVVGVAVTFAVAGGGRITGALRRTDSTGGATIGSWTLAVTAGPNTLTAVAEGLTGSPLTFTALGVAGGAAAIAIVAGDDQTAAPGSTVSTRPAVKVADANANPVAGVTVIFAVESGAGAITGATAATDSSGIATVGSWTLGSIPGTNTLRATVGGVQGGIVFTANRPPSIGSFSAALTLTQVNGPYQAFQYSTSSINAGQLQVLTWAGMRGATVCSIDNGVGSVPCRDSSVEVSPESGATKVPADSTLTYTMTASGPGGSVLATTTFTVFDPNAEWYLHWDCQLDPECLSNNGSPAGTIDMGAGVRGGFYCLGLGTAPFYACDNSRNWSGQRRRAGSLLALP